APMLDERPKTVKRAGARARTELGTRAAEIERAAAGRELTGGIHHVADEAARQQAQRDPTAVAQVEDEIVADHAAQPPNGRLATLGGEREIAEHRVAAEPVRDRHLERPAYAGRVDQRAAPG